MREFKIGDIVHFQAYTSRKPIKAKVVGFDPYYPNENDDRVFYKVSGISSPLTSTTTGGSLLESRLFSPVSEEDAFKD